LTALEVASGVPVGAVPQTADASPARSALPDVRAALEGTIRPALRRPPCFVAFSGGRDSSVLLAVAARLATREGLAPPVALTARFPGAPATDESAWQEGGISAVGLEGWERLSLSAEEVEALAPRVRERLLRHGLLYPPNAGLLLALLDRAGKGSLITGLGGDELLGAWRHRGAADVLAGRRPLGRGAIRALLRPLVPRALLRQRAARSPSRHGVPGSPWLTPPAARAQARSLAAELAEEPHAWDARVRWKARRRRLALTRESLERVSKDTGTLFVHPLLDPRFAQALASAGGRRGFGDRTATLRALFGDMLPRELLERPTKAHFDEVFWGPATRAFARQVLLDGRLAVAELLDRAQVAAAWSAERPPAVTLLLLQASWLATSGKLGDQLAPTP
jgi:asparagine synthetase B (glutamine-hydrolysing)